MVTLKRTFLLWAVLLHFAPLLKSQCLWTDSISGSYVDSVNAVGARFIQQINAIKERKCPSNALVFTGSSSIRIWKTLASDFPDLPVCNTGFGGSTLPELITYLPELVYNHAPKGLLIYCGENDISLYYSKIDDIINQFEQMADSLNRHLPNAQIWFLSIKPSLLSRQYLEKQNCINRRIKARIESFPGNRWHFINIQTAMLSPDGEPNPNLFLKDGLHMNAQGYQIWKQIIQDELGKSWNSSPKGN
ncbi:MAG: GDSL-type esterase/lipase family protein [Bacteroidetes bacterium]|nr:GDSL-type esterase/lipase family protein [Bacteroidota bacterium]